ncbi:hypothetical protein [Streptomyces triticiradicis]|uniref:Uncharacterized protein n=1 Tax=Streptomyces triticiradicis TaxID=2651189 RepID=A0A7J5D107_9ACTN|nr:hypothetical protein [Streptomyces triticiradicis]KAB1973069.1 hypothetical protein F8144_44310 [Streptomyces triticiradicis]
MESTQTRLPPLKGVVRISPARLLSTPLPELLDDLGAELVESSITDPTFVGALVQRHDGSLILSMPPGRPRRERDCVARAMLGRMVGVPLGRLPEMYELTEV